jgi:hypothetical protein
MVIKALAMRANAIRLENRLSAVERCVISGAPCPDPRSLCGSMSWRAGSRAVSPVKTRPLALRPRLAAGLPRISSVGEESGPWRGTLSYGRASRPIVQDFWSFEHVEAGHLLRGIQRAMQPYPAAVM